ncbi:MAG: fructose-6-phosphate aldolase [Nitrospinota bacterium]
MKLFIDTGNVDEVREAAQLGILDGVTTNPTLLSKEGRDPRKVLEEVCGLVEGPVNAEVVAEDFEGMVVEGRELAAIRENIVVKVPMTAEGIKAVKRLREEGIETNVTLCFSPAQALLAAKAGASYVSPFIGRLDDVSHQGMALVRDIITIFDNYDFSTQVIVASVRHPLHVVEAALAGADVATVPFAVIGQLLKHPLTDIGLERFLRDWERAKNLR